MQAKKNLLPLFYCLLLLLTSAYLLFEFFFNQYATLSADEFWFAHKAYEFQTLVPYRDFVPYKTVLGYYVLTLPMLFGHGVLHTLVVVKNAVAIINAFLFLIAGIAMSRLFTKSAVLASLIIILLSDIVLTFSTNIRVDVFAYWWCFFAMIFLLHTLRQRNIRYTLMAGIFIGLGFCTSQKVAWYWFAIDCTLSLYWLAFQRNKKDFLLLCLFNVSAFAVLALYIAIFASISSLSIVFSSMFTQAVAIYQADWYEPRLIRYWIFTLRLNPLLFLLVPIGWLSLCVTCPHDKYQQRFFIVICTTIVLFLLITYRQAFPYYLQVMIPGFMLFFAAIFDWLLTLFADRKWLKVSLVLLPVIAAMVQLIPITRDVKALAGDYQHRHLLAIDTLLKKDGDYFAGIDLLYNRSQPVFGLELLAGPTIGYLNHPTEKLKEVMLPSLNLNGSLTVAGVLQSLRDARIKLYVNNYRVRGLPPAIQQFLANEFLHYSGSVYLYAPRIAIQQRNFVLKFSGEYLVMSKKSIDLRGHVYKQNAVVFLKAGNYRNINRSEFRLRLIPENQLSLGLEDDWLRMTC